MPPTNLPKPVTIPTQPPELIPNPDPDTNTNQDDDEGTIAGLRVTAAKKLTRDAFNVLLYAYPGVGKTTLSGMFADYPPARDVLVVDAEGGASVLSHRDYVDVVQVQKWPEADKLLTYLERTPIDRLKYRTVCFDNVTELHTMLLQSIAGTGTVEIQHHGRATAELMRFVRRIRDLSRFRGLNTVVIGWQDSKENKASGLTRQTIALTDKLATRLPGIPNNVGYVTILNNPPLYTRRISFAATPMNDAKFRRATGSDASPIPDDIYYSAEQNPIADILRTLYEGVPFPVAQYMRPKGRGTANTTQTTTTDTGDSA